MLDKLWSLKLEKLAAEIHPAVLPLAILQLNVLDEKLSGVDTVARPIRPVLSVVHIPAVKLGICTEPLLRNFASTPFHITTGPALADIEINNKNLRKRIDRYLPCIGCSRNSFNRNSGPRWYK